MRKLNLGDIVNYNNSATYMIVSIYFNTNTIYLILKDTEIESFKTITLEEIKGKNYKVLKKSNMEFLETVKFEGNLVNE